LDEAVIILEERLRAQRERQQIATHLLQQTMRKIKELDIEIAKRAKALGVPEQIQVPTTHIVIQAPRKRIQRAPDRTTPCGAERNRSKGQRREIDPAARRGRAADEAGSRGADPHCRSPNSSCRGSRWKIWRRSAP
jgi:hypothetical protein